MRDDLAFDADAIRSWFQASQSSPYVLIRVSSALTAGWEEELVPVLRRCYVPDGVVEARAASDNVAKADIVKSRLPDPGAVMCGDFGEILAYLYQASITDPSHTCGVKKWRLKQDRRKPAPYSDVVHFVMPRWPEASDADAILCAEVKAKATDGGSVPIQTAITDSQKDATSRLAATLVWLRDRAYTDDLGDVTIEALNRFIQTSEHPPVSKVFRAVAVVCESLLQQELATVPSSIPSGTLLVVISVPALQATYAALYCTATQSLQ